MERALTTRVIGIGNALRGDDAAGLLAARLVREVAPPTLQVDEVEGDAARLLELLAEADRAILIDAVHDGRPPGTVRRVGIRDVRRTRAHTTHLVGLAKALGLTGALGRIPERVSLYVIGARRFGHTDISPKVDAGVREAAERIPPGPGLSNHA